MPAFARSVAAALSLVVGVALATPASAGPATDTLRRQIDRIFTTLADPQLKGSANASRRHRILRTYAEETVDFREAARRSLGSYWEARTPDERARFVQLFTDLIDQAYLARLSYNGERVLYDTETATDREAIVQARALGRNDASASTGDTPVSAP